MRQTIVSRGIDVKIFPMVVIVVWRLFYVNGFTFVVEKRCKGSKVA